MTVKKSFSDPKLPTMDFEEGKMRSGQKLKLREMLVKKEISEPNFGHHNALSNSLSKIERRDLPL